MSSLIFEFLYGFFECRLKFPYLADEELREPKQNGCRNAAFFKIVDYFLDIGGQRLVFRGTHDEIAFFIDSKIILPPIFNAVSFSGLLDDCAQFALLQ